MTRKPVAAAPAPDSAVRPYERLVPLVEALVAHGNELVYDNGDRGFIPQPDGYSCFLAKRIDFALLAEQFQLPDDLVLQPDQDTLHDWATWVSVYGPNAFNRS